MGNCWGYRSLCHLSAFTGVVCSPLHVLILVWGSYDLLATVLKVTVVDPEVNDLVWLWISLLLVEVGLLILGFGNHNVLFASWHLSRKTSTVQEDR